MTAQAEAEFLQRMAKHIPLRRTPTPKDIAEAVVYLLGARAVTGTVIEVDGGRHLGRAVYG
jgi:NAD(P)-dependent dehydrogenase (short-subunit alcohol dehydrogenase family)